MGKRYIDISVYEAFKERMRFIFAEFDHIIVSFSGGKDSGLLLNLVMQYADETGQQRKICLFHQDFEAQYEKTTEYVLRTFNHFADRVDPYWICLPVASKTSISNYELYWHPWDPDKQDIWVRPLPQHPAVITLENNPFDFYEYKMLQEDLYKQFGRWYKNQHGGGKVIALLGLRADESLHRYNSVVNKRHPYKGQMWITRNYADVYSGSPLYDWTLDDVWIANTRFQFDYNGLYDSLFMAGVHPSEMRVASPFNEWAAQSLEMYRVIEPKTWTKLVGRVQGANFAAIYGSTKAMGYRNITLPPGHTWKSYTEFLLSTLSPSLRESYIRKFKTSLSFWAKTGGGFDQDVIREIEACGYRIKYNGVSNYTKDRKVKIIFDGPIPDHTDDVKGTTDIPSWKRMCICILKNDHLCRYMGFGPTKTQRKQIDLIRNKYKSILYGGDWYV